MAKIAIGTGREATQPDCIQALIVEFICTFLFVFVGVGAAMATDKLAGDALVGLFFVAMAHALVVAVMICAGFRISGGHLNPAVTLGLCAGGHITVFRTILYWIDQCLASAAACALLKYLTGGLATPVHTLAIGMGYLQGVIMEIVLTFSLLFTVYTTIVDPKKGFLDGLGPLLTGLVIGANIMVGGAFSGASMNPARSFGPALVSGIWTDHWVYWVGPLIGGGLAGLIYENCFIVRSHVPLPREAENF
ncbi:aquaporin TIP4-1-like [Actinidia eriantha]|uniref:aquaporin TIP4-1-like n=1 Tax=Actinidia eriantha TaxID=165200 RepID=UPI0001B379B9|nr:aquaporin TIP4-1-like [Actinidia eriantha]